MNKIIAHIDMDAFFASVEQAVNPKYRGKPLIVGSRGKKYRTVVAACSYEAKAFGVSSGMSTVEAFRLCPQAEFISADSSKYIYTSSEIFELLKTYSQKLEMASVDEFYLDFSHDGLEIAVNKAIEIKEKIKSRFAITCSVGISSAKLVAKIAGKIKKPDGLMVVSAGEEEKFMSSLLVEKVPGIGPALKQSLNYMSIFTCGQLAKLSEKFLLDKFGKLGFWLADISKGIDLQEVGYWDQPQELPKSIGHSHTLENNINSIRDLKPWIRMLCEMVGFRLRKECLQAYVVHFYLRGNDGFFNRQKKFGNPTFDSAQIYKRAMLIFDTLNKFFSVRALGISVSGLVVKDENFLFEDENKKNNLITAVDKINNRFGDWSIYPASLNEVK